MELLLQTIVYIRVHSALCGNDVICRHDSITQGVSQRLVFLCPLYVTSYVVHPPLTIDLICCLCCFPFPAYGTGRARVLSLCVAASPLSSM